MESAPSFRQDSVERNSQYRASEPGPEPEPAVVTSSAWPSDEQPEKDGESKGRALPKDNPTSSSLSIRKTTSFQVHEVMGFFDLPGEHRVFHGPLGNMYPSDCISRPQRHCQKTWEAAMSINGSWPTQRAEDTGMATFWNAMLAASRKLRKALASLCILMEHGKFKSWMLEVVMLAAGQLTNSLGLSLEFDHAKNLSQIPPSDLLWFNFEGQKHRHDQLISKIWVVVRRLEGCLQQRKCSQSDLEEADDDYKKFHAYLTMTAKVVLEDALYFYRQHLTERQFSCVCHRKYADNPHMDEGMFRTVIGFVAAATPSHCRSTRFKAMGYNWLESQQVILFGMIRNRRQFQWPLDSLIRAATKIPRDPEPKVARSRTL